MKLWIDDVRPAPEGYVWCKSVNEAKQLIQQCEDIIKHNEQYISPNRLNGNLKYILKVKANTIEVIDLDHDAGEYVTDGGDYIKLLDWLEETGRNYPIHIHSMNPVGVENMRRIIRKNGWREV